MKWLGAVVIATAAGGAVAADLHVVVEGVESREGNVRLALYDDPKTFRKGGEMLASAFPTGSG